MAGLNYGYGYTSKYGCVKVKEEGVFYMKGIKYWVVRVKKKGIVCTVGKYSTEAEANEAYASLK